MATENSDPQPASPWNRGLTLLYGIACYAVFFVTALYAMGFIGGFVVPTTLDGPATMAVTPALLINLGLLAVFAVQHSLMARPAFKRRWIRFVPPPVERSTYVLFSSAALIALFAFWQPIGGVVWEIADPVGVAIMYSGYVLGWIVVFYATFLINHFDLFGLRQVYLHWRGRPYTHLRFATPGAYTLVRHPLYVGWLMVFWFTPTMTAAHLVFAVMTTAYILIAVRLEERDLLTYHGEDYADYQRRVPMLIPRLGGRTSKVRPA